MRLSRKWHDDQKKRWNSITLPKPVDKLSKHPRKKRCWFNVKGWKLSYMHWDKCLKECCVGWNVCWHPMSAKAGRCWHRMYLSNMSTSKFNSETPELSRNQKNISNINSPVLFYFFLGFFNLRLFPRFSFQPQLETVPKRFPTAHLPRGPGVPIMSVQICGATDNASGAHGSWVLVGGPFGKKFPVKNHLEMVIKTPCNGR